MVEGAQRESENGHRHRAASRDDEAGGLGVSGFKGLGSRGIGFRGLGV